MHHLVDSVTYSPEDNKLRIFVIESDERFNAEEKAKLDQLKFRWAPLQRCFFAAWTPAREDFINHVIGCIQPEMTTIAERAEAKIERLQALSEKREAESNVYATTAIRMAQTIANQPILLGHHSQRKAEKQQDRAQKAADKAVSTAQASMYWQERAIGVAQFANMKNNPVTRANRMKELFKDLRTYQRRINHGKAMLSLWNKIDGMPSIEEKAKYVEYYAGHHISTGSATYDGCYSDFCAKKFSTQEFIEKNIACATREATHPYRLRIINHLLNRLGYERHFFGETPLFNGKLTATVLKQFARQYGAEKPECKKVDGQWLLSSSVELPLFIAFETKELTLTDEKWLELMQSCGFVPPAKAPAKPPILNFEAESIVVQRCYEPEKMRQVSMTKAEYSAIYSDYRGVALSKCGNFRVKMAKDPKSTNHWTFEWVTVFLTDSKVHPVPESDSIINKETEAA